MEKITEKSSAQSEVREISDVKANPVYDEARQTAEPNLNPFLITDSLIIHQNGGRDKLKAKYSKTVSCEAESNRPERVLTTSKPLLNCDALNQFLDHSHKDSYSLRAIHICQSGSWSDLSIDDQTLNRVIVHHDLMPELTELTSLFSSKRLAIEEAFSGQLLEQDSATTLSIGYVMKYPECKTSSKGKSWVIRQIGIYQQYLKSTGKSIWVFLHCEPNSSGQKLVTSALEDGQKCLSLQKYPIEIHLLLISIYLQKWREYMSFYETELLQKTNTVMGARLIDLPLISHPTISRVHFLSAHFSSLPSILAHQKSIFRLLNDKLKNTTTFEDRHRSQLSHYSSLVDSYSSNTLALQGKCASLLQFVVDSIGINNQLTAQKQNELMIKMAQTTVNDSECIKIITIVTLLYLPASFVATFFGMQFFQLDASKLWIFFSLSFFLTVLTMLAYWWFIRKPRGREDTEDIDSDGSVMV